MSLNTGREEFVDSEEFFSNDNGLILQSIQKKKRQLELIRSFILSQELVSKENKEKVLIKLSDLTTKVLISEALRKEQERIKKSIKDRGLINE